MNENEINQALNNLYQIARQALVSGDTGDIRDKSAQIIQAVLQEKYEADKEIAELKEHLSKVDALESKFGIER